MADLRWTPEQQRAIDHQSGPLRIIAGAGAGKTATMTEHIARLIQSEAARPEQIVALTFTNAAASELSERIQRTLEDSNIQVWSGTYHAFGGQVVADGAQTLDLPAQPTLLSQVETWLIVRQILRDGIEIEQRDMANFAGAIQELVNLISRAKDELATPATVREYIDTIPDEDAIHAAEMRDFLRVYEAYQIRCHARGAIDFGDQIMLAIQALDSDPELLADYRDRYRYFVVDEYQDTNYAQAELIRRLAAPDYHLRVVGDPQQSIYRFRGAAVDNIERFGTEIEGVTDVTLETNFRSHQDILDVANRIVEGSELAANLRAHQGKRGPTPIIASADQWWDEVQWITETLQEHASEGTPEMAVLVRKRKLLPSLARALDRAGVPHQILGGQALFEFPAVKDAVAVIRLMSNPADTASAVRVLTSPRCGLNDRTVFALREYLTTGNYLSALNQIATNPPPELEPHLIAAARAFCDDMGSLVRIAHSQPVDMLTRSIVERQVANHQRDELQALEQLVSIAAQFTQNGVDTSLSAFVDYLTALADMDSDESRIDMLPQPGSVSLLTIHGAKGLEFDVVVLAGMNRQDAGGGNTRVDRMIPPPLRHDRSLYPSRDDHHDRGAYLKAVGDIEKNLNADEERRLYYVATTRARDYLYVTWSANSPSRKRATKRFPLLDAIEQQFDLLNIPSYPQVTDTPPLRRFFQDTAVPLMPSDGFSSLIDGWSDYWKDSEHEAEASAVLDRALAGFEARRPQRAAVLEQVRRTLDDAQFRPARRNVFSYSQISTYEQCPRLYLLRYLVGVPSNPADEWRTQLGTAFHDALHALHLARTAGIDPDFRDLVRRSFGEASGEFESDATHRAIDGFLRSTDAQAIPIATEQEFYLRLGSGRHAPVIRGFIDRLQRTPDGDLEIVDYKTNRQNRTRDQVLQDLQLPVYVMACREALGIEPRYATMAFVRHANWVRIDVRDMDLTTARQRIDAAISGITAGHFDCTCHGTHCQV